MVGQEAAVEVIPMAFPGEHCRKDFYFPASWRSCQCCRAQSSSYSHLGCAAILPQQHLVLVRDSRDLAGDSVLHPKQVTVGSSSQLRGVHSIEQSLKAQQRVCLVIAWSYPTASSANT